MSLADDLKDLAADIRDIPGSSDFAVYAHRVFLVETNSSGDTWGEGAQTTTETEVFAGSASPPKVKQIGDEQRAIGDLAAGSLLVGPITPPRGVAGITVSNLNGSTLSAGTDTLRVRVDGPMGNALYTIKSRELTSATKWMLTLEPMALQP